MTFKIKLCSPFFDTNFHQREPGLHVRQLIPFLGTGESKVCLKYLVARNKQRILLKIARMILKEQASASRMSYCLMCDKLNAVWAC